MGIKKEHYDEYGGGWCPECGYLFEEPYKPGANRFLAQILR